MERAVSFLGGATAMGYVVAGIFFLRFWRETADRLFAMFAAAMWVLALNAVLAMVEADSATLHYVYGLRLVSFDLIIAAVVDKSRSDGRM